MIAFLIILFTACGVTTQDGQLEDASSNNLELPWHAFIYEKSLQDNYEYIHSGSLLTPTKIISAAYYFYDRDNLKLLPASNYVVAGNKKYSKYNDTRDKNTQYSDVTDIIVPSNFTRIENLLYHNDYNIAILVVKTPFDSLTSVRPARLGFDHNIDSTQMTKGSSGKTIRWSLTGDSDRSKELTVVDIPYYNYEDCKNMILTEYQRHIVKDQFCTRYNMESWQNTLKIAINLAFVESSSHRFYLRGIVAFFIPTKDGKDFIATYIPITKLEEFIKQHL